MNKVVSIILPTYNMEKYLHKCLDSLIVSDENMELLEVLVINDGSKDASSQIAHEYETKYPQTFRVVDKENGNYGSCINRGLKEATGKYVKVLDADDYYDNEIFSQFLAYLCQVEADLIINDFCTIDENGAITETYTFDLSTSKTFTLRDIPPLMVEWLWHHGITYKTKILQSINYWQTEGISYTDDEWVFMPMIAVHTVLYFPHMMYHYLLGREGQTFDPNVMKSSFDKRVIVGKSMAKFYGKVQKELSDDVSSFMTEKLKKRISVIYNFYLTKHYTKAGNEILKEFDLFVKHHATNVYDLLGQSKDKLGGHNYIYVWREAGYRNTLYLWLRQVKFKIRLLLGMDYRNLHMPDSIRRK